jgi:hypothetical protein
MYTRSRHLLSTATILMALVASPAGAQVQTPLAPIKVTERGQRAAALDREAAGYEQSDMSKWRKAASLRKLAATLRPAEDPKGAVSLFAAAHDRYYSGDEAGGRVLMARSAERALAIGDVVQAATAFTEAAYIASGLRDYPRAREYARRATLLAYSPMLSDAQRSQLRSSLVLKSSTSSPPTLRTAQMSHGQHGGRP